MRINPLFILPNLFTASSAFLGILSIIYASKDMVEHACWFVIISMILDGLDGRVARVTNTTSKFGIEFDSLCDLVAFGCAPAMILYFSIGNEYGRLGVLISCLFVVFGAVRLARFNVMSINEDSKYFIGLPIPSAAIFVVTMISVNNNYDFLDNYSAMLLVVAFIVGILMVSNIRYPNFKKISWSLRKLILLIILFGLIFIHPMEGILLLISLYIIFGVSRFLYIMFIRKILN